MKDLLRSRVALFAAVGIAAVGIAVGLIVASVVGSDSEKNASPPTAVTTASATTGGTETTTPVSAPGAEETNALLAGIPQKLNVLGSPKAPVTMIEFADLQCPFCRDYALVVFPTIVREYVRPGKVKLVFSGMAFLGADSEKALRATYAAGLQGRLWNYMDLLYKSQGAENSGWVTDDLLRTIGRSIPGVDPGKLLSGLNSEEVDNALAASQDQSSKAGVNSTPTFFVGPTGGTLQQLSLSRLEPEQFRPALDALLK